MARRRPRRSISDHEMLIAWCAIAPKITEDIRAALNLTTSKYHVHMYTCVFVYFEFCGTQMEIKQSTQRNTNTKAANQNNNSESSAAHTTTKKRINVEPRILICGDGELFECACLFVWLFVIIWACIIHMYVHVRILRTFSDAPDLFGTVLCVWCHFIRSLLSMLQEFIFKIYISSLI